MQTIEQSFERYMAHFYPDADKMSQYQKEEIRQAFFCGAATANMLLQTKIKSPKDALALTLECNKEIERRCEEMSQRLVDKIIEE